MKILILFILILWSGLSVSGQYGMTVGRQPDKNKAAENANLTNGQACGDVAITGYKEITGNITKNEFAEDGKTLAAVIIKSKKNDAYRVTIDNEHLLATYPAETVAAVKDALMTGRHVDLKMALCGTLRVAKRVDLKKTSRSVYH